MALHITFNDDNMSTGNAGDYISNTINGFEWKALSAITSAVTAFYLPLSGGTVTGNVNLNSLSATTISGGTLYSGSTNLYDIFATSAGANDITRIQPGLNTYTGGTANEPTINISAATLSSLSATTISGGTLYSGSTNLYSIFSTTDTNDITRVQPGLNTYTGGTTNAPTINISAATLSSLSATTVSGGTLYSGNTNLYSIFSTTDTNDVTRIQPGLNIYTGGTVNEPTINVSAATLSSLSATTVSGGTLYSGSTNLYSIFSTTDTNDVTRIQPGLNTYTGGTANEPTINISAATLSSLSATTISGGTLYSGSTNLYSIFSTTDTNDITRVQPGLNTYTGGTTNEPTINISAATLDHIIISGNTNTQSLTASTIGIGTGATANQPITSVINSNSLIVSPFRNISTGTAGISELCVENSASRFRMQKLSIGFTSGGLITGDLNRLHGLTGNILLNTTTTASTIFSIGTASADEIGSFDNSGLTLTNHRTIAVGTPNVASAALKGILTGQNIADISIQNITNSTAAQARLVASNSTGNVALISLRAPLFTPSGIISGNTASFLSNSPGRLVIGTSSGSDDIIFIKDGTATTSEVFRYGTSGITVFSGIVDTQTLRVRSGATLDGTTCTTLSGGTISGGTLYSGSTNLYDIFATSAGANDITRVQPGSNIVTGGTDNFPTISITPTPSLAGLSTSGNVNVNSGKITSGGTDLYSIFQGYGANSVLSQGLNTYTGGTFYNQTINVSAATLNNIIISGSSQLSTITSTSLSATTVSANTFVSGGTNLSTYINAYPQTYQFVNAASVYINASTATGRRLGTSQENSSIIPGANSSVGATIVRIDSSYFPSVNGMTPKFRVRVEAATNNAAITANYRYGIAPVVVSAATAVAGNIAYSATTFVVGSTVDWLNPPAATITALTSSEFSIPSTGNYVFMLSGSATNGATTNLVSRMYLEVRYT